MSPSSPGPTASCTVSSARPSELSRSSLYQLHVPCFIQLLILSQSTHHQWRITSVLVTLQTVCWRHVSQVLEWGLTYTWVLNFGHFSASKSGGRLICRSPYTWEYTVCSLVAYLHRHMHILPITSADNIHSIFPHRETSMEDCCMVSASCRLLLTKVYQYCM